MDDRSLRFSFFALSTEELQTQCWGCESDFGSLGKVKNVSGSRMDLIAKFIFDDNLHFVARAIVHERRALWQAEESRRSCLFCVGTVYFFGKNPGSK